VRKIEEIKGYNVPHYGIDVSDDDNQALKEVLYEEMRKIRVKKIRKNKINKIFSQN
jgi:hypothetical protein